VARNVLVVGASGVVGVGALRHFAEQPDCSVVGVSRRRPPALDAHMVDAHWRRVDLNDRDECAALFGSMHEVTHVVYTALFEKPGLVGGWADAEHSAVNLGMFRNVFDALLPVARDLRHVTLLQGTKAYGVHLPGVTIPIPARERWPRFDHENFYFHQEDDLRSRAQGSEWSFTILRPQVVYGESLGSPMNLVPAIGVYGAICRAQGLPLAFPGGAARVSEAVDADLLAHAIDWAGTSDAARGETFNVTNGDVFVWRNVWPAIAEALGMELGADEPRRLASWMPRHEQIWADVVERQRLRAPAQLDAMIGESAIYADLLFGHGVEVAPPPVLVSTVKIRQAGFGDCVDTEDMFVRLIGRLQATGLLPPPV
jgi:nucleoside-diphosphate-sugar epimerase